jgi:putative hydrolase of the HAD superfamily
MPAIEGVLFDYGNTIVQYDRPQIEWIHARLSRALSRLLAPVEPMVLGVAMDHVCVQTHLSPDLREYTACEQMELVLRQAYGDALPLTEEMITAANAAFQDLFVSSIKIEAESVGVVRRLSRKVRLGLISNYPCGDSLRRSLRSTGIADLFDPIVVSGDVGYVKPHPRMFSIALDALGVPPGNVLYVGDNWIADMLGGRRAGMRICHFGGYTSAHPPDELARSCPPDFAIQRLSELESIVSP